MTPAQAAFDAVTRLLPALRENKKRETARLVYEICKRDGLAPQAVLDSLRGLKFQRLKAALLKKRYPSLYGRVPAAAYYLPGLDLSEPRAPYQPGAMPHEFRPKLIYIEKTACETPLAGRAKLLYPNAGLVEIDTVSEFVKTGGLAGADYNARHERLLLFKERYDFIKPCPCTKNCVCCGYNVLNLGFGCVFDCEYCFLQEYQNFPAVALPCNVEDFLDKIPSAALSRGMFKTARLGTGEFTDSLVFDHLTGWAKTIARRFEDFKSVTFEFKTKSVNCGAFFEMRPVENIVISWSLNPSGTECEHFAAAVAQRIKTAAELAKLGWRVGFHFDPMILYPGWQNGYKETAAEMLSLVRPDRIAWISAGTLRFRPPLKKTIEARFPANTILDSELIQGFDGKMRYSDSARADAYRTLKKQIDLSGGEKIPFYLCMENAAMWSLCGLTPAAG
ncbi:MAG: hypothetical protein PHW69_01120 [Elusimicrobiaceae bacterium]|nr:hypothetical protein [Elusimicrobiaceae bacterium]